MKLLKNRRQLSSKNGWIDGHLMHQCTSQVGIISVLKLTPQSLAGCGDGHSFDLLTIWLCLLCLCISAFVKCIILFFFRYERGEASAERVEDGETRLLNQFANARQLANWSWQEGMYFCPSGGSRSLKMIYLCSLN